MKKIPAGAAIRFAYQFTFGHIGTIIGLVWVPLVLWGIGDYFIQSHQYSTFAAALAADNPLSAAQANLLGIGWNLVSLLLWAVMSVAVMRQALGLREGPAIVHFALGGMELRLFAAIIGLLLLLFLFTLGLVILVLTLAKVLGGSASAANYLLPALVLLGMVGIIYAYVRLGFFIVPVAAAERRIGLSRSWELAGGNVGRIVLIGLGSLLPISLLIIIAIAAVIGPDVAAAGGAGPFSLGMTTDNAAALRTSHTQIQIMADHLPAVIGIMLVSAPFLLGLQLAPAAFVYRALTGNQTAKKG